MRILIKIYGDTELKPESLKISLERLLKKVMKVKDVKVIWYG